MEFDFLLNPQIVLFGVLGIMFALFVVNKIRFDLVALGGLVILVLLGVIPTENILAGFSNPAILTIISIFIFSAGLVRSGLIDAISRKVLGASGNPIIELFLLMALTATISGFINNVAAVSLMIPIAVKVARTHKRSLGLFLMPLAFASLLGGLATSIGTTPNIIIASMREETLGTPFSFFDFAPVGYSLAAIGIIFLGLIGWRLIPPRREKTLSDELFDVKDYLTEVKIKDSSKWIGKELHSLQEVGGYNLSVIGIIRESANSDNYEEVSPERIDQPSRYERLKAGDILLLQADSETLETILDSTDLELLGSKAISKEDLGSDSIETMEVVVEAQAPIVGQSMKSLGFRAYGINLLALARENKRIYERLADVVFQPGDVLLLRGKTETLFDTVARFGALPLRKRDLRIGTPKRIAFATTVFLAAIGLSVIGIIPVPLVFLLAAGAMIFTRLLPVTEIYDSINWPVVVLLGSMLTISKAFEDTGAAETIADFVVSQADILTPSVAIAGILTFSMLLSNAVDSSVVAVILAPVAILLAQSMGVSIDPFLMATAVGCSTAFLTPIGGKSSTLVMSPAGYHFGDYTKVGSFLSLLVLIFGYILILTFWSF